MMAFIMKTGAIFGMRKLDTVSTDEISRDVHVSERRMMGEVNLEFVIKKFRESF